MEESNILYQSSILKEKTGGSFTEKHLPMAEINGDTITVKVEHPMGKNHYIKGIWVISKNRLQRVALNPEQKPEAMFVVPEKGKITVLECCNLHGFWRIIIEK